MSWSPFVSPVSAKSDKSCVAVSAGCNGGEGRYAQGMILMLRPHLIDVPPAFLRIKAGVQVMVGHSEHAGWIRLAPGARYGLANAGGSGLSGTIKLRITGWTPLPAITQPQLPVEFDYGNDWLDIKLPDWAIAEPKFTKVVTTAVAAPVTRANGLALAKQSHAYPKRGAP